MFRLVARFTHVRIEDSEQVRAQQHSKGFFPGDFYPPDRCSGSSQKCAGPPILGKKNFGRGLAFQVPKNGRKFRLFRGGIHKYKWAGISTRESDEFELIIIISLLGHEIYKKL